jgi:hypothetical protein
MNVSKTDAFSLPSSPVMEEKNQVDLEFIYCTFPYLSSYDIYYSVDFLTKKVLQIHLKKNRLSNGF